MRNGHEDSSQKSFVSHMFDVVESLPETPFVGPCALATATVTVGLGMILERPSRSRGPGPAPGHS